jgi:hypothetical protein
MQWKAFHRCVPEKTIAKSAAQNVYHKGYHFAAVHQANYVLQLIQDPWLKKITLHQTGTLQYEWYVHILQFALVVIRMMHVRCLAVVVTPFLIIHILQFSLFFELSVSGYTYKRELWLDLQSDETEIYHNWKL